MNYTRISADKAYAYARNGHAAFLYFQNFTPPFDKVPVVYVGGPYRKNYTRAFFRARKNFWGSKSEVVTIRQLVNCFISNSDVLKVSDAIVRHETGKSINDFPVSHRFSESIQSAAWKASTVRQKWILFDVDVFGQKSNFRFEDKE